MKASWLVAMLLLVVSWNSQIFLSHAQSRSYTRSVAWSPDSRLLAVWGRAEDATGLRILDWEDGSTAFVPESNAAVLAWSLDGLRLAARTGDTLQTLKVWDTATLQTLMTFTLPDVSTNTFAVAWSYDGRFLASSQIGLDVWDVSTGVHHARLRHVGMDGVVAFAWHPQRYTLYSIGDSDMFRVWDAEQSVLIYEQQLFPPEQPTGSMSLAISPNGQTVAIGDSGGEVHFIDASTFQRIRSFRVAQSSVGAPYIEFLQWLGNSYVSVSSTRGPQRVIDVVTGAIVDTFDFSAFGVAETMAVSPYGARIAIAHDFQLNDDDLTALSAAVPGSVIAYTLGEGPGNMQVFVPDPSPERLASIAAACDAPPSVVNAITAVAEASEVQTLSLDAPVSTLETALSLEAEAIPPACAADLLAVAEAMRDGG